MVGDRLNTDIEFGKAGGLATLLVLSGVYLSSASWPAFVLTILVLGITSEEELTGPNPSPTVPDYVTESLGDLRVANQK